MRANDQPRSVWLLAPAGALLALLVAGAYLPLRHNEFVNFDDDRLILDNPSLRDLSPEDLGPIFRRQLFTPHYKPLVYLSWAAELRLFGPDPLAFHLDNLLLHLVNALLVLGLAARLVPGSTGWRTRVVWAAAAAALWALHPLKVESVAWASERKDVLFAAFYLGSMSSYLAWLDGRRRRWLLASVLLALGGVLSKSTAITLPGALLLLDLARRRRPAVRLLVEKAGHLGVAVLALYLYGLLPGPGAAGTALPLLAADEPLRRLVEAGHRHLAFAARWLAPVRLAPLYPIPEWLRQPGWMDLAAQVAVHLGLAGGLVALFRRSRRAAAAALFYTLTLVPALVAPISTSNYLSDRYLYLPSLGLTALALLAAAELARRLPRARSALAAAGLAALALLALLTWRQVGVWRHSESLWSHNLQVQPPHAYAYNNRGVARLARGDPEGAREDFERALATKPGYAEAHANRGALRRRGGDLAGALRDAEAALAGQPGNPALHRLHGSVLADLGRLEAAVAAYDRALRLDPRDFESLFLRAQVHRLAGDLAAARADIDAVLAAPGGTAAQHLLRALIRAREGDLRGALADTARAVELDPGSALALNNRGFLHLRLGEPGRALDDLDRALALRPVYPLARRSRGDALAALGRLSEACADWRAAAAGAAPGTAARLADCPPAEEPPPNPAAASARRPKR